MNVGRLSTSLRLFQNRSHNFKPPHKVFFRRPLSSSPRRFFPRQEHHVHGQNSPWPSNGRPVPPSFTEELATPSLVRPTLFAVGLSGLAYYAAGTATNRDTQIWAEKLGAGQWWRGLTVPGSLELQRARLLDLKYVSIL
ncbi:hypothetical protein FRC12_007611 [Ceratobasidium sp. 428]|nr:hypothetical protein FRC12_007611 [Ceratobasidium sp. 428]